MTEANRKVLSLRRRFDNCEAKLGTVPVTESIAKLEVIFREAEKLNEEIIKDSAQEEFEGKKPDPLGEGAGFRELFDLRQECNDLLVKLHHDSRN